MIRDLALKQDKTLGEVSGLVELGEIANGLASASAFETYRAKRAVNTVRRQESDLALFAEFIRSTGVQVGELASSPEAWRGVTWGLVAAFQAWLLGMGYAVGSVNLAVSTVKTCAKLAFMAGVLSAETYALIKAVEGLSRRDARHVDQKRQAEGLDTRRKSRREQLTKGGQAWGSSKKSQPVKLSAEQSARLKDRPDTPQGRRDAVIMCLLLEHGLRVGELAALQVEHVDLITGTLSVYRPKVDKTSVQRLTGDTFRALSVYLHFDAERSGLLLKGSQKRLHAEQAELAGNMSERAIFQRVKVLSAEVGAEGLSPHDCRHYAATKLASVKTLRELMDIFGWSSPAMAARYIQSAEVVSPE